MGHFQRLFCNEKIDKVYSMELQQENIVQSQDKKSSTSKEFHCNNCTKKFKKRKNLTRHVSVVHHNVRPFSCEDCKKAFSSNQELVHHSEKGCQQILVKPSPQLSLKNFQKIIAVWNQPGHHNDVRPFSCEVCKKEFALKIQLDLHNCTALKGIVIWLEEG